MKLPHNNLFFSIFGKIGVPLSLFFLCVGCVEQQPALYTFTGDMVYSFLKKDTTYSEYAKIVEKAGLKGMLSAYGSYTCLAPTNEAFRIYYKSHGIHYNIDSLSSGQIDTIAKAHIIPSKFLTTDLNQGVIPSPNMNRRYVDVKFEADTVKNLLAIVLNYNSKIVSKDNDVFNGVVHGINAVLKQSNYQLPDFIGNNPNVSIFYEALILTRLSDSLRKVKDMNYVPKGVYKDEFGTYNVITPKERKFSYTAFVEDNELFKNHGINNIQDLIEKANQWYPSGKGFEGDYTNRYNSLNQFVSYHLVKKSIYQNQFFYTSHAIRDYYPDEFIETMLLNRIMKASMKNKRITLNCQSNSEVCIKENNSMTAANGVYHILDNILIYSQSVEQMLVNTRIRLDFASLFPELTNNGMRCSRGFTQFSGGDRYGFDPGYIEHLKMTQDTRLLYLSGTDDSGWIDFQGDDLVGLGAYDITMRLLPVPPGTYELRFGYTANPHRSVTQIYVDNKPVGIPLDLKVPAIDPKIGYLSDNETDDDGYENDKMMRNRGYMKGPNSFKSLTSGGVSARNWKGALRRIIATFTFTDYQPHYLRFRSVTSDKDKQMQLDYIEYVPKNLYSSPSGDPESRD